jgi:hypothetical protein
MDDEYLEILCIVSEDTYTDLELNLINSMIELRLSLDLVPVPSANTDVYFHETILEMSEQAYKVYSRLKK